MQGELQQANFEKHRLKEALESDHRLAEVRRVVDRIQKFLVFKEKGEITEADYTRLKEMFGVDSKYSGSSEG